MQHLEDGLQKCLPKINQFFFNCCAWIVNAAEVNCKPIKVKSIFLQFLHIPLFATISTLEELLNGFTSHSNYYQIRRRAVVIQAFN